MLNKNSSKVRDTEANPLLQRVDQLLPSGCGPVLTAKGDWSSPSSSLQCSSKQALCMLYNAFGIIFIHFFLLKSKQKCSSKHITTKLWNQINRRVEKNLPLVESVFEMLIIIEADWKSINWMKFYPCSLQH